MKITLNKAKQHKYNDRDVMEFYYGYNERQTAGYL